MPAIRNTERRTNEMSNELYYLYSELTEALMKGV